MARAAKKNADLDELDAIAQAMTVRARPDELADAAKTAAAARADLDRAKSEYNHAQFALARQQRDPEALPTTTYSEVDELAAAIPELTEAEARARVAFERATEKWQRSALAALAEPVARFEVAALHQIRELEALLLAACALHDDLRANRLAPAPRVITAAPGLLRQLHGLRATINAATTADTRMRQAQEARRG